MLDKQAIALKAPASLGQRTSYFERAIGTGRSLEACRRVTNGAQWAYEHILKLLRATEAQSFFEEGCPGDQLMLKPHQQEEACSSTWEGGLGSPSAEARGCPLPLGAGLEPCLRF